MKLYAPEFMTDFFRHHAELRRRVSGYAKLVFIAHAGRCLN